MIEFRKKFLLALVIVTFIGVAAILWVDRAFAAEPIGKNYPYLIFNDEGVTRYCYVPNPETLKPGDKISCWAKGKETICSALYAEEGYIDCKENEND